MPVSVYCSACGAVEIAGPRELLMLVTLLLALARAPMACSKCGASDSLTVRPPCTAASPFRLGRRGAERDPRRAPREK